MTENYDKINELITLYKNGDNDTIFDLYEFYRPLLSASVKRCLNRDKKLIALVLVRLQDLQVRDFALGSVSNETLDIYFNAWRWLLRNAPLGYVAPVANLFAAVAYERGDGALAHRALDRAESDEPGYAMTPLLRKVFISGWSPSTFAAMRSELHPRICDAIFSGSINS